MGKKSLALGRGLDHIFKDHQREEIKNIIEEENKKNGLEILKIKIDLIDPNPFQPRKIFNDEEINELAETIKQHGLIQPITVRKFVVVIKLLVVNEELEQQKLLNSKK